MLNKEEEKPKYTKEYILNMFEKIFENVKPPKENNKPIGWTHNVWEENGQHYSSWTFNNGCSMFTTGDKGKEEFDKLFAEGFKDNPKPLK